MEMESEQDKYQGVSVPVQFDSTEEMDQENFVPEVAFNQQKVFSYSFCVKGKQDGFIYGSRYND
jgi:hypothetical protein